MVCLRAAALAMGVLLAGCAGPVEQDAPAVEQAWLEGVVVTQAIVPIPGASVRVDGTGLDNVTDADGEFRLGPLELGGYQITVDAAGYGRSKVAVQVVAGEANHVNVVLQATSTQVPYHEVEQFTAFIECSYAQRFAGVVGGNFNCLGITDLLLGIKIDNDRAHFPFTVRGDGFVGLLAEMVWEPQPTMPNWSGYIRDPAGVGGGVGLENQYWSAVGESPIVAWVLQGVENDGAYTDDIFHPDANATQEYEFRVAGMSDTSQPVDVAIALQQEMEIFLSRFYHQLPGDDYGIV